MEEMSTLLDQLESKLKDAKRLPGGVMSIIEQMRSSLHSLDDARDQIERDRERAIELARQAAESIVSKASEEAERLVAEKVIVQSARTEADGIRVGADEYAFEVLCQLEQELTKALSVIANGLRTLQDKRELPDTASSKATDDDTGSAGD